MDPRTTLFLLILSSLACHTAALTFKIDANEEQCYYEEVEAGVRMSSSFQVASGGFLDIDVKIVGPDNQVIYSGSRETEGKYTFVAALAGQYAFCFSNRMSTMTSKSVSFNVDVGDAAETGEVAKAEHLDPIHESVRVIESGLVAVQEEQKYMRMRERVHRNTSESTNARVLWWSFFEAVVLVASSVWQIHILRRFFEVKRAV